MSKYDKYDLRRMQGKHVAEHLAGKKMFRISCCGRFLDLERTQSIPETNKIPFARVSFVLRCMKCERELEVEVCANTTAPVEEVIAHLVEERE